MENEALFRDKPVWNAIISMAIPSVIAILVMIMYNVADLFFVGQTGDTAQVAAVSIVGPLFSLAGAVATMLGGGGCAVIAKSVGAGDFKLAKSYASHCFWGAITFGLLISLMIFIGREPVLSLLGVTKDVHDYAVDYLLIAGCGVPFMLISMSMSMIVRAEGAIKEGLIGNLLGTVVNIILDPVFIMVLGLGVKGAAIATVLGNLSGTIYFIYFLAKKSTVLTMDIRFAMDRPMAVFYVFFLGMPNAISSILDGFASGISNKMLSGYGTETIAAMGAAGKVSMIVFMLELGICMGIQPLLAYNYGSGNIRRLNEIIQKILILTCSLGVLASVGCFFARHTLVSLFLKDDSVISLGEQIVPFLMFVCPVVGLFYLSTNFLQASGNAVLATLLSVTKGGALLILALLALHPLFGLQGIFLAYSVSDVLSVVIAAIFMIYQHKQLNKRKQCDVKKNENPHF